MGYDCFRINDRSDQGRKNALISELNPEGICKSVLAENFVSKAITREMDEMYIACELNEKFSKPNERIVALVGIGIMEGEDYCVKLMIEKSGPVYYNPSQQVLDALSDPAPNEWAKEWREKSSRQSLFL